ncbi:alpha/beta fold hydrolase [Novosphingobium sp. FSY-8]|uniref:Alpha/beta fold hydrolase n=1 Tax=Novosphingobium ovatum TaxID=1908523 RepID=A0ABW9X8Z8_9SPHN|nr:alpha/beta hydrolase [Novosphingobium ovatum]NBC35002.1 alpha/beta fold hydrolase [Novosphingobium ovatum]
MRRAYADGRFGQIHYQYAPADQCAPDARPVVLMHQAIMASGQFDYVFAPLIAGGLRPIAIDMPGFGLSDAPATQPAIEDYATCIAPVLDALGIGRTALVGHHTGALVSTEFALAHPERVEALVIHGPMILSDEERAHWTAEICTRERAFRAEPEGAHLVNVAKIREFYAEGTISPDRITDYVVQAMQAYRMGAYAYGHAAAFAYEHTGPLGDIKVPTMLLSNTGDMTHPWAETAAKMFPHFAFAAVEGGGIDICDQAPDAWAGHIVDFVRKVAQG